MDMVRTGKISTINYAEGTASVAYTDRNNEVSPSLPFFSICYEMPKVDELAVVIMLSNSMTKGFIIGIPYSAKKMPAQSGKGIFYKEFSDGASILYNPETKTLSANAEKITLQSVTADSITVNGTLKAKSIEAERAEIGELIVDTIKTKNS